MTYDNGIGKNQDINYGEMGKSVLQESVGLAAHSMTKRTEQAPTDNLDAIFGYRYEQKKNAEVKAKTAMDNFDEFLKMQKEQEKEDGIDEEQLEEQAKKDAKEIAKKLSPEEISKLRMLGIDVSSAKLSDVMGMVNTMRHEEHRAETAELFAKIRMSHATAEELKGMLQIGSQFKVAGTDISVDINTVEHKNLVQAGKMVAQETGNANRGEGFPIGNGDLVYLLKNNMTVTKDNLYKAHFSGTMEDTTLTAQTKETVMALQPQLNHIFAEAGYEMSETSLAAAGLFIQNEIPVTADTIREYMNFQKFVGENVAAATLPENAEELVNEKAEYIYQELFTIVPEQAYEMAKQGQHVSIESMLENRDQFYQNLGKDGWQTLQKELATVNESEETQQNEGVLRGIRAMRSMEQIRLSMTYDAARKLVNADFNLDTRSLETVVDRLKSLEETMVKQTLSQAKVPVTEENITLYQEMNLKVKGLATLHAGVLGTPIVSGEEAFTVNALHIAHTTKFQAAVSSYEAVGTAPRADMGDSITKAFSNVRDILQEMNLPVTAENERAVRILGYNSIAITEENIQGVGQYDMEVRNLMANFYPEAVLSMIKDGINPMDVPITELNDILREKKYNAGVSEVDNFATYLREALSRGEVTEKEREAYVGIYRVVNKLAKSGDREAGFLFANGGELTVRNLLAAMRSRRAKGMDVSVDETFGMVETLSESGKRIDAQIEGAFLKEQKQDADEIAERLENLTDEVVQFMTEQSVELNLVNGSAVYEMQNSEAGIYGLVYDLMTKLRFDTNEKENLIDEETENMADSMSGEEIPYDFTPEGIIEALTSGEDMSLTYDKLRDQMLEMMYATAGQTVLTDADFAAMKTVQAGFSILSGMAKREQYQIPVQTEQGTRVMNLKIEHSDTERGKIQVTVPNTAQGTIQMTIRVSVEGSLSGYVWSDSSQGNYYLAEQEADFKTALVKHMNVFANQNAETDTLADPSAVILGSYEAKRFDENETGAGMDFEASRGMDREAYAEFIYKTSVSLVRTLGEILTY